MGRTKFSDDVESIASKISPTMTDSAFIVYREALSSIFSSYPTPLKKNPPIHPAAPSTSPARR